MSGKIVVGIMGLLAAATAIFGIWFLVLPSPIDQRFNLSRESLTAISNPALLLPSAIGDFQQKSLSPFNGGKQASAGYADDMDNLVMNISATLGTQPTTQQETAQALQAALTTVMSIHADAPFPFAYGKGPGGYTFTWINGPWQFVASTSQSDPESLLQFVNTYIY